MKSLERLLLVLLHVVAVIVHDGVVATDCPDPSMVPVRDTGSNKYIAAVVYQGPGAEFGFQACNGPALTFVDGDSVSAENPETFYEIGSLIVKAGCNFYGFREIGFAGESHHVAGPQMITQHYGFDYGVGNGYRSWHVSCKMPYIDCQPSDNMNVIISCDAIQSVADVRCTYSRTVGTTYSTSVSESMNIDVTIKGDLEAQLFEEMGAGLSVSASTGYNWGSVSTEVRSLSETVSVSSVAPPGYRVFMEQGIGYCNDNTVHTDWFKTYHEDKDGNISQQRFIKLMPGQKELNV